MRVLALVAIAVLLAGCAAGSKPSAAPSTAAVPVGAIEGRVVGDDQLPLAGVRVVLLEMGRNATTGGDGGFRFDDVLTGRHTLVVETDGYRPVRQSVEVLEDNVSRATLALEPMATIEPYIDQLPFEGYIQYGNEYLDMVANTAGASGCQKCVFHFNASGDVVAIVSEITFVRTVDNPHGPEVLGYGLFSQDMSKRYTPPGQYWGPGGRFELDRRWGAQGERFVHTHACDDLWFCLDQTFTNYVSLFHHAPPAPGYTALAK